MDLVKKTNQQRSHNENISHWWNKILREQLNKFAHTHKQMLANISSVGMFRERIISELGCTKPMVCGIG